MPVAGTKRLVENGSSPVATSPSSHLKQTGSPGPSGQPLKYKRHLVEDFDSDENDKIVTSTKKQRTRSLELSRKEGRHCTVCSYH